MPTDRERPALSEGTLAAEECRQTARELRATSNGNTNAIEQALYWERKAETFDAVAASPKPALTQGGVVELVDQVFPRLAGTAAGRTGRLAIEAVVKATVTALERLAGERGGEAVALDEVAFRGGFAKGSYECLCMACGETFEGDKRAFHCRPCAIAKALPDPPAAAPQPLPVEVEREDDAFVRRIALMQHRQDEDATRDDPDSDATALDLLIAEARQIKFPIVTGRGEQ